MGNKELIGVIPAGGKGVRAYPSTKTVPKCMLEIAGKPILARTIQIMRDKLNINKIYIISGHLSHVIKDYFKDGSNFGVELTYIEDRKLEGLANAILLVEDRIEASFVVMLGDEVFLDSNHEELLEFLNKDFNVICAVKTTENMELIKKNYSVKLENGLITSVIEKPDIIENNYVGCGVYFFNPIIFDYIRRTPKSKKTGRVELNDAIGKIAKTLSGVYPFFLEGYYANINTREDLNLANYIFRDKLMNNLKTSLIIPAYNEEETIGLVINDFKGKVNEILIAIDNKTNDNTGKIAQDLGAKVIKSPLEGYGCSIRYAIDKAQGEIIILTEADGTFRSKDLEKFLGYIKDCDMVVGTRTTRELIEQGANMKLFLRVGNIFLGKLMEFLWWKSGSRFTDVGCTYRAFWKSGYDKIKSKLRSNGPEFSPELMIEMLKSKQRVIEIPISYHQRFKGESKFSKNLTTKTRTGLKMLYLIIRMRFFD